MFDKLGYDAEYTRTFLKRYVVNVNKTHDEKLFNWIENQKNFSGYVKDLIREDMKKHNVEVD